MAMGLWRPRDLEADARSRAQAATVLALAFGDDPVARYVDPDPARRAVAARPIFDALVTLPVAQATIRVVGDPIVGVAIWLTPEVAAGGEEVELWADLSLPFPGQLERFREAISALDVVHAAAFGEPHVYLLFVGVRPDAQGSGAGSALLAELHADADAAVVPCLLESFGAPNRAFYERRGYEVIASSAVSFSSEVVDSMRRRPGG
jgi:ribosomal protein S18 acetylase RimI-like enzyme